MDHAENATKPSIHAERAYALILSGFIECSTALEQRLLLDSLVCQCAAFTRILSGEQEFFDLLERLKYIDCSHADWLLPRQNH